MYFGINGLSEREITQLPKLTDPYTPLLEFRGSVSAAAILNSLLNPTLLKFIRRHCVQKQGLLVLTVHNGKQFK